MEWNGSERCSWTILGYPFCVCCEELIYSDLHLVDDAIEL